MKWLSIAILVMVVFAFSPAKSAEAADFSFSVGFHDELSPYGTWVNYSSYGNVWRPYGYSGWRPYMDGYWGDTSYGPTWYGNEPYAPYVYHYGYWIYTARYGWVWIPGNDYHAGRVDWSYGGGYIGWRPQFPSGYHYPGSDYNFWVVIGSNRFGYNSYRPYALGSTRVRDLFARRVFRQRYDTFRRADLERVVRRPLRRLNVREREIRIGDRRARILATANDEVRIRKHVSQIRGTRDDRRVIERRAVERRDDDRRDVQRRTVEQRDVDRRAVEKRAPERNTVMKRKFEDIRKGSSSKSVRKSDDVRKPAQSNKSVEKSRVEKSKSSRNKSFESKGSKKVYSKPSKKIEKRSNEKPNKSNLSSRKSGRDSVGVRKASFSSRKPAKVEKARFVRKSETRSHGTKANVSRVKSSGNKANVSKAKRTTKREPARKQKPRKRN
jgi:hypothetical protein